MALRFMDGFEQFEGAVNLIDVLSSAGYAASGAVSLSEGRTPNSKAVAIGNSAAGASLSLSLTSSQQYVSIGFAYNAAAQRSALVSIENVMTLGWDTGTGVIVINGNPGEATIVLGVWYYYEIVIDKSLGEIRVYINNELDLTVALPSSANLLSTYKTTWSTSGDFKRIDDITMVDSSVGEYTTRIGPVEITTRVPTNDVLTEWVPAAGLDHFEMVNNIPPVSTDYIQSNVSDAWDTFLASGPVSDPDNILAVGIVARAKKSDIDGRKLGLVIGDKTTSKEDVVDLSTSNAYKYAIFETDPSGVNWTDETTSSTPFGVAVRP